MSALEVVSGEVVGTRLAELETVISHHLSAFIEVGEALSEIRDSGLYGETHATFEDYCRERWDFSRPRAYELMHAAEVVSAVSAMADIPTPASERVARELAPLRSEPDVLRGAWAEVVEQHGPTPTAKQVHETVSQFRAVPSRDDTADPGPQKVKQQVNLINGIAEKARRISELAQHIDLEAIESLPEEEKTEWKQQLSSARTVLSRVIGAL